MRKYLFILVSCLLASNAYAIDIPNSATVQYRGNYGIPASMTFQRNGQNYTVVASINVPLYKIRFESGGTIVDQQLVPSYYRDTRNGKLYASAQFSGNQVSYGKVGETKRETVSKRVMDLFTLSWQLAFSEGKLPSNLLITNGKRLYPVNGSARIGNTNLKVNRRDTTVQQLQVRRGDDTVLYGFAPTLGGIPALIQYNDGSKSYRLTLQSVSINGKNVSEQ